MATTTLKAIIDRFQAVCEGGSLNLQASLTPFSLEREPNAVTETAYYIEDGGLSSSRIGTSDVEFRVDTLTVWLASRMMFAGQTKVETMQTTLGTLELAILADGPANDYHATVTAREAPQQVGDKDVFVGGLTFAVDYDYATA